MKKKIIILFTKNFDLFYYKNILTQIIKSNLSFELWNLTFIKKGKFKKLSIYKRKKLNLDNTSYKVKKIKNIESFYKGSFNKKIHFFYQKKILIK